MVNFVQNIFNTTEKLNVLSNTKNLKSMISKMDKFTNNDKKHNNEDKDELDCDLYNKILGLRQAFVVFIFIILLMGALSGSLSVELFAVLSLLTILVPDIVLMFLLIFSVVNMSTRNSSEAHKSGGTNSSAGSDAEASNKYSLSITPSIFN